MLKVVPIRSIDATPNKEYEKALFVINVMKKSGYDNALLSEIFNLREEVLSKPEMLLKQDIEKLEKFYKSLYE